MGKKISVNMENDAVTSIEIDGVRYASADEIPDAEDRAKIAALMAKPGDAQDEHDDPGSESDEAFDAKFDKEFEKEVEEIKRSNAKFPLMMMAIFLTIAGILLAVAGFSTYSALRTIARQTATPGRVVDVVERQSFDNQTGETKTYSYPVVEFTMPGGEVQRVELNIGSWPPSYEAGDHVTILYDPAQPQAARIKSFSSALFLWLLPAITGFMGAIFLFAAGVVLWMHREKKP